MEQEMNQIDIQKLSEIRAETINEIEEAWKSHDRVACVRYPGFGKSYYIVKMLVEKHLNKRFLILVHRKALLQRYKDILFGYNNITIYTYQYIQKNNINFEKFDILICDECHHCINNTWASAIQLGITDQKVLGLTANEYRSDKTNITDFFEVITSRYNLNKAFKNNLVQKINYITGYYAIDDDYIREHCNNAEKLRKYFEEDKFTVQNLLNPPKIIQKYINVAGYNSKAICFVSRIEDILQCKNELKEWYKKAFPNKIINIYEIHTKQSFRDKQYNLDNFSLQKSSDYIDIIISVDILREGIHIENVNTVIMIGNTSSPVKFLQQIGRAINQREATIIDFARNCYKINYNHNEYFYKDDLEDNSDGCNNYTEIDVITDKYINFIDANEEITKILQFYSPSPQHEYFKYQLEYLKLNAKNMNIREIAKYLEVSTNKAQLYCYRYNIEYKKIKNKVNISEEQWSYLNINSKNMTRDEIAHYLNLSKSVTRNFILKNNIKYKNLVNRRNITEEQLNYLRQNSKNMTTKNIMLYLNESYDYVRRLIEANRLPYIKRGIKFYPSKEQLNYLKQNSKNMTRDEIQNYCNISVDQTSNLIKKYGLTYKPKYEIKGDLNIILKYLNKNIEKMTLIDIKQYLGINNNIVVLKFLEDYNLLNYKKIDLSKEQKDYLYKNAESMTFNDIRKYLGYSAKSVENLLRKNNIDYKKRSKHKGGII